MCIWVLGGEEVPVSGMPAGMNLSKPGMNLSNRDESIEAREKHNNHVIMIVQLLNCP